MWANTGDVLEVAAGEVVLGKPPSEHPAHLFRQIRLTRNGREFPSPLSGA